MQALILAGGKGTRLRPLTVYTPKPIVPICNRPFLLYQIDTLRRAGITDITLSLSYQPNKIEHLLGDGSDHGVKLKYTVEPQPMGTAGAYKFAEDLIREPTVVFNGDILTDLDLKAVIREHNERKATATVVLARRSTILERMVWWKLKTTGAFIAFWKSQRQTRSPATPSTPARTFSNRKCSISFLRARTIHSNTACFLIC